MTIRHPSTMRRLTIPSDLPNQPGTDVFSVTMELPVGIHSYKFIVDGEWRYAEDQQTVSDDKVDRRLNNSPDFGLLILL